MDVSKELIQRYDENAIMDINWINNLIHKAIEESKESYVEQGRIRIYINHTIGYINFKSYKYIHFNKALIIFAETERDKLLNDKRRKSFNIGLFKNEVMKRMSSMILNNSRDRGFNTLWEKVGEKRRRKRISIDIEEYIK